MGSPTLVGLVDTESTYPITWLVWLVSTGPNLPMPLGIRELVWKLRLQDSSRALLQCIQADLNKANFRGRDPFLGGGLRLRPCDWEPKIEVWL